MLTLSTGLVFSGLVPSVVKAQESELWYIHEDEFNTAIILPNSKKRSKAIATNRFDQSLSRYETMIKKAEAAYPFYTIGLEKENGKPLWYSSSESKTPYNVTPRAVNYYFNVTVSNKNSGTQYKVEVAELFAVTKYKKNDEGTWPQEVYEVSLNLSFSFYCGRLCGSGFNLRKKIFFNEKGEIIALYMPQFNGWVS